MYSKVAKPVRIYLYADTQKVRRWALVLAEQIKSRFGIEVSMIAARAAAKRSLRLGKLERIEQLLLDQSLSASVEFCGQPEAEMDRASEDDLLINLSDSDESVRFSGTSIRLLYNETCSEYSIVEQIWSEVPPVMELVVKRGESPREVLLRSIVAILHYNFATRVLELIASRAIALCLDGVAHLLYGKPLAPLSDVVDRSFRSTGLLTHAARGYFPIVKRRLAGRRFRLADWAIVVKKRMEAPWTDPTPSIKAEYIVPCPNNHFYADPVLYNKGEKTYLFFEDYSYDLRVANISYAELRQSGIGDVHVALAPPYHLSYPMLFEHDGVVYMVPESAGNRSVELYYAAEFPHRWELKATLIRNRDISDATLHYDRVTGLWWMFASESEFGTTGCDVVSLFYSERLESGWKDHPSNPVKYDARSSRSAGPIIEDDGRLFRPTQDCSQGYGHALTWCEILEMNPSIFRERVVCRQEFKSALGYAGPHTYGRTDSHEVYDIKRRRRIALA